tara:strand:+ start:277 stop:789 length:513 start_codon:yes stop_codon:yes gene_type:complete
MALTKLNFGGNQQALVSANIPTLTASKMPANSIINVKQQFRMRVTDTILLTTSFTEFLAVSVTPATTSSKFWVSVSICVDKIGDSHFDAQLRRDVSGGSETVIGDTGNAFNDCANGFSSVNCHGIGYTMQFIDSPATTTALEYKFYMRETGDIRMTSTGPASITAMEIAG